MYYFISFDIKNITLYHILVSIDFYLLFYEYTNRLYFSVYLKTFYKIAAVYFYIRKLIFERHETLSRLNILFILHHFSFSCKFGNGSIRKWNYRWIRLCLAFAVLVIEYKNALHYSSLWKKNNIMQYIFWKKRLRMIITETMKKVGWFTNSIRI